MYLHANLHTRTVALISRLVQLVFALLGSSVCFPEPKPDLEGTTIESTGTPANATIRRLSPQTTPNLAKQHTPGFQQQTQPQQPKSMTLPHLKTCPFQVLGARTRPRTCRVPALGLWIWIQGLQAQGN